MRRAVRSPRGRGLLLAVALLLALGTLTVTAAQPRAADAPLDLTGSRQLLLRLPDLPPGYEIDDETCEQLEIDEAPPSVAAFIRQYRPAGCFAGYERIFRARGSSPSATVVGTVAFVAPSVGVAEMGAAIVPDLLTYLTEGDGYTEVAPPTTLGEVTRLFHVTADGESGSVLVWRDGPVLALLLAQAETFAAADATALQLGARQQAHIDSPTPYPSAERDDSLVELDDPRLLAPVYWLGKRFAPGHGFPSARTERAYGLPFYGRGKNRLAFAIDYTRGLVLIGWNPPAWKHFSSGEAGRRDWTWHCTRSRRVQLRQGHAVVYAAYNKDYADCPDRPPRHFFAHVFLPGTVVGINREACTAATCSPFYSPAFNSFRGMATVARHLHPRAPRTR